MPNENVTDIARAFARRYGYPLAVACMALACSDARNEERTPVDTAQRGAVSKQPIEIAPVRNECFAPFPKEALTCGGGAVSRSGDTLVIRLLSGRFEQRVTKSEGGESVEAYTYAGRIGGAGETPALHVIEVLSQKNESFSVELINAFTGKQLSIHARPIISPDGARFAVVANHAMETWDGVTTCGGSSELAVWRITGDVPVNEFRVPETFDCVAVRGWGPSNPVWRSADTISFLRITIADSARRARKARDTTIALLVRQPKGWMLDAQSKELLPLR